MTKSNLIKLLNNYSAFDEKEKVHTQNTIHFVNTNNELYSRNNMVGHVTASAIVVDREYKHVVMIWHEKLQRWLQPGGHVEIAHDNSLIEAASRELAEETGLNLNEISLVSVEPFDLDVHRIPARKNEVEHDHFDFRFLYRFTLESKFSDIYKWVLIEELLTFEESSLNRIAAKIIRIKQDLN
ncbi:MAG: NUDIX hydrolase [Bacteroidales bacterium]